MIKIQNCTPEVYYQKSRDFQFLGRLFDLALNSVKASSDMIYTLDNMSFVGTKLVGLLATTLGFKQKHEYSINQLKAVCSILPTILRKKGTLEAISLTCTAILRAEGLTDKFDLSQDENDPLHYILLLPQLQNITLLLDLLNYIWPAGATITVTESGSILSQKPATKTQAINQVSLANTLNDNTFNMQVQVEEAGTRAQHGHGEFTSGALYAGSKSGETTPESHGLVVSGDTITSSSDFNSSNLVIPTSYEEETTTNNNGE